MTTGIFVVHTPAQVERASRLVDLFEAALPAAEGAIVCSSLPGYALQAGNGSGRNGELDRFRAMMEGARAVIALIDDDSVSDQAVMFELAYATYCGHFTALVLEHPELGSELPWQLQHAHRALRGERGDLVDLLEDIAGQLHSAPRVGHEVQLAMDALLEDSPEPSERVTNVHSTPHGEDDDSERIPEQMWESTTDAFSDARTVPKAQISQEVPRPVFTFDPTRPVAPFLPDDQQPEMLRDTTPQPPLATMQGYPEPQEPLRAEVPSPGFSEAHAVTDEEVLEELEAGEFMALEDHELSEVDYDDSDHVDQPDDEHVSCRLSLEAGRAISECSFHRDQGGDFRQELEEPFGRFVEAVGGDWSELKRIPDVDVWLGATDNLLESLPPDVRHISDWFELGFQYSTLMSIAEQGLLEDPEQRPVYADIWKQSMAQFQRSAEGAQLRHQDVAQMQSLLENLIGPAPTRDYTNIPRSLEALRNYAGNADQG